MATMANIVVKKADNTTDITWTALSQSAGDKSPAQWRSNTASTISGNRPTFSMSTQWNGPRTARQVTASGKFPLLATENGVEVVKGYVPMTYNITLPQAVADATLNEAVYQFANLIASALIKQSASEGFAPS